MIQESEHKYRDTPPFIWAGSYDSLLRYGGDRFPLINELRNLLTGRFRLVLKLSNIRSNLYVNGKARLVRHGKFKPIWVYSGTKIIEGTDAGYGGSNTYPCLSFKEGYCIVEVIVEGFPTLDLNMYDMKIEIIDFEKLV